MDLRLDANGDLDITDGDLSFVTGLEAIAQDITMKLRTWLGESVYDRAAGVPYLQVIFTRGISIHSVRAILEEQIRRVEGVLDVLELEVSLDHATRVLTATGRVRADEGVISLSFGVTA